MWLIAKKNNMDFRFRLVRQTPREIEVEMYNTSYILVKNEEQWENSSNNKFVLSAPLVNAVLESLGIVQD